MPPVESYAAVAFADLSGYTALTDLHGDRVAIETADRLRALALDAAGPAVRLVKTIGDAVMLVGPDPAAVLATTLRLAAYVETEPRFPTVGIGIHAGPVLERGGDLFGHTVNVAARVAALADGTIVVTESVARFASEVGIDDPRPLGPTRLRNLVDPVELFAIGPSDDSPAADVDPMCRMRLDPEHVVTRRRIGGHDWPFCSLPCADRFEATPDRYEPRLARGSGLRGHPDRPST